MWRVEAADGLAFQHPRSWNSGGKRGRGRRGAGLGRTARRNSGGLPAHRAGTGPYDRLDIGGRLWEVRAIQRWPSHRKLMLQRVR